MMLMPSLLSVKKGENMKKQRKRKRLTFDDRIIIQACLLERRNITEIASRLHVHKSTISRELKNNSVHKAGANIPCTKKRNGLCNKCPLTAYCHKEKSYYDYLEAEKKSKRNRSLPRSNPKIPESTICLIDDIVSKGASLGQSIHHIYIANPSLSSLASEQTIRRLCYRGCLSVKAHQLRRYVRYKHSCKKEPREIALRDIRVLIGRTYQDYQKARKHHPSWNIAQYDSVIGKREDRKALLTITFPKYSFQFGYLIEKGSPSSVLRVLKKLFKLLGKEGVKGIFPINLADNGTEFSYFPKIEEGEDGEKICSTYFTSPYKATDKAACERLHELVRYLLPKGHSLNGLTQEMINEMYSHINSYVRKSKGDQTPYDLIKRKFGENFLTTLGIHKVPKKKVRLLPII